MKRKQPFLLLMLIAAACTALFIYNPWLLYFQNDDLIHIPLSKAGIVLQRNSFRPICDISMIADYRLFGKNAAGYHFTNLLLHLINCILVFTLVKIILKKYLPLNNSFFTALTTAVFFWIYMNHSEAVFWIIGRSAMLGMLFFLPAIIFYLFRKSGICFFLSLLCAWLAWLSYESTLILPLLFFLISFIDVKLNLSTWKKEIKPLIACIILFALYCVARVYFMGVGLNYYNQGAAQNINASFIAASFLKLIIRSWLPPFQSSVLLLVVFFIIASSITVLIFLVKDKKAKHLLLAIACAWLVSLLPYILLSVDTKGVESERYLYLPSFFICMLLSILLFPLSSVWREVVTFFVLVINIFGLNLHATQYRFAGAVVQATVNAVNNLKGKHILFAENVPEENYGALIFRSGFKEGINWLKNKGTVDSVIVLSHRTIDLPVQKNYPVKFSNNVFLTNGNIYFMYTDNGLIVSEKP